MLNTYEAMFIFTDAVKPDGVDDAVKAVTSEMEKLKGSIDSTTRLGKRSFARPLQKQESGQYVVVTFQLNPAQLPALKARYKLMESVLRVQFIRVGGREPAAAPAGKGAK